MQSCKKCPHLLRNDFDGIPYWRCGLPKEKTQQGRQRGRPIEIGDIAKEWLREYLKDGPKQAGNKKAPKPGTLYGDAVAAGFKCNTIWRAAKKIGVRKQQEQLSKRWMWELTENCASTVEYPPKSSGFSEFNALDKPGLLRL